MFYPKLKLFTFFAIILFQNLLAQSPNLRQITGAEGLPSMNVYDILQDKKGFIWLGTDAGLCKYDGYKFQKIKVPNSKGKAFSILRQDKIGRIYFQNFANQLFYIQNNQVQEIPLPKGCQSFRDYNLDKHGILHLIDKNIYYYDHKAKKWIIKFRGNNKSSASGDGVLAFDKNNQLWAMTNKGMIRQNQRKYFQASEKINGNWRKLFIVHKKLYLANTTHSEVLVYQEKQDTWKIVFPSLRKLKQNSIIKIIGDRQGSTWVITRSGAFCFDKKKRPLYKGLVFLKDKFVSSFIQDREGNYWFTTIGEGVFVMYNKDFLTYHAENSILPFTQITCLEQDDKQNIIIAGNANQAVEFNPTKNQTQTYKLAETDVECIFLDKKRGQLFIENGSLNVFDTQSKRQINQFTAGSTPKDIVELNDNTLLVASGNGAYLASKNNTVSNFGSWSETQNATLLSLRKQRSRAVCVEKSKNRFWVGYADGLYFYEKNGINQEIQSPDNQDIIALDMIQDGEGVVWVATAEQGIFGIKNKKIIKHLTTQNGLISNFCRVLQGEKNKLWIGTDKGVQVWYLKQNKTTIFTQEDGLASNEIRDIILQNDKVWVATANGLTVFDKNYEQESYTSPLVYITDFAVWEKSRKLQKNYTLSYQDNNIKIEFVGLAFQSHKNFQYQYRLLGLSEEWISVASPINFVRYPSLPAGKYTFEVKVINKDGIESEQIARLSMEVLKPFWQEWWFIVLNIFVLIILVSAVFMWRIRAIHKRNNLKQALINANLKALKTQMNPHFIFNSLMSIQAFILQEKNDSAERYLSKFAQLTRLILEASRQDYIKISEEVAILESYLSLEQAFSEHKFEYALEIAEDIEEDDFKIPPLFAQPFIENAIKHGILQMKTGGKIEVSFHLENKLIAIYISDNGMGRKKSESLKSAKKHQSLATQITNERIELLQRTIAKSVRLEIEDILDNQHKIVGTRVKLFLPYKVIP